MKELSSVDTHICFTSKMGRHVNTKIDVDGVRTKRDHPSILMAFQQQVAANAAAGVKTPPVFPTDIFGQLFLLELLFVVAFAAVVRATVRPVGDRFAYLRLGMDELRLVGLGFLLFAAAIAAEMASIIVLAIIGGWRAFWPARAWRSASWPCWRSRCPAARSTPKYDSR